MPGSSRVITVVFGPGFILLAWLIHRNRIPPQAVPWVWASFTVALAALTLNAFRLNPTPANLAYVAIVMVALGPRTYAWLPFVVASISTLAIATVTFAVMPAVDFFKNFLVCLAALLISAVLLRMRWQSLKSLAEAQALAEERAMTDELTDLLNRRGLQHAIPGLVASARRSGEQVLAWYVDIRGLKQANDELGHAVGRYGHVPAPVGRLIWRGTQQPVSTDATDCPPVPGRLSHAGVPGRARTM